MNDRIIKTIKDWLPMVILLAIPVICVVGMAVIEDKHDDQTWALDAADKLNNRGGWIYTVDGGSIRVFAHLKPTTSVEYRSGAFYVTDPSNSNSGLYIVPLDQVSYVLTG